MKLTRQRFLAILLLGCLGAWLGLLGIAHWYEEGENYSLIEEGLYLGGDVPQPPRGTQAVINLHEAADPYQCEVHVWEPIPDSAPAPSLDWLRHMVETVALQRQEGRTTFVHCRNGVSRSGMVVVAYLMHHNGWTRDEALDFVRSRRPLVRPNPAFMDLLSEWERELKVEGGES